MKQKEMSKMSDRVSERERENRGAKHRKMHRMFSLRKLLFEYKLCTQSLKQMIHSLSHTHVRFNHVRILFNRKAFVFMVGSMLYIYRYIISYVNCTKLMVSRKFERKKRQRKKNVGRANVHDKKWEIEERDKLPKGNIRTITNSFLRSFKMGFNDAHCIWYVGSVVCFCYCCIHISHVIRFCHQMFVVLLFLFSPQAVH